MAASANISIVMILITCFFLFVFLPGGVLLIIFIINAVSKSPKPQDKPKTSPKPTVVPAAAEEAQAEHRTLGENIKIYREKRNMTQEFVAENLGVSRQAVSKWENGTSEPSTGNLLALAKLFGVSAAELLQNIE